MAFLNNSWKHQIVRSLPSQNSRKLIVLILILILILLLIANSFKSFVSDNKVDVTNSTFQYPNYTKEVLDKIRVAKRCFRLENPPQNVQLIDDLEKNPPKTDTSIFFLLTSCLNVSSVQLSAREACAVESAARSNPNRDVYVLVAYPAAVLKNETDSPVMGALKSYPNVHIRNINPYNLSKGTLAEQWIKEDRIFTSQSYRFHISDYLRIITLSKFGGIYFDLDMIIFKNLDDLPPNFTSRENPKKDYVNNSSLGFKIKGIGRILLEMLLRETIENYKPDNWDYNGPRAIHRTMLKVCNKTNVDQMAPEFCWGWKVMPTPVFFPFSGYAEAFDTNRTNIEQLLKRITNDTVAAHFWSSGTRKRRLLKSKDQNVYTILAQKYCPKAYGASGLYFDNTVLI